MVTLKNICWHDGTKIKSAHGTARRSDVESGPTSIGLCVSEILNLYCLKNYAEWNEPDNEKTNTVGSYIWNLKKQTHTYRQYMGGLWIWGVGEIGEGDYEHTSIAMSSE